eukprot:480969_1
MLAFAASCLFVASFAQTSDTIFSLGGNDWTTTNGTKNVPASVPGSIYVDLMNAGVIGDPYYGSNPDDYKWVVVNNTWTYTKTFTLSSDIMNMRVIQLVSEGLDTLAYLSINDQLIFTNDNIYQRNHVEIKNFLKTGSNTIKIVFPSKVQWALQQANSCNVAQDGLCPKQCPGSAQHGFCDVNFIRTEPCSFSWDWGPAFASVGVWKDLYLQAYNDAVIRDVLIWAKPINGTYGGNNYYKSTLQFTKDEISTMSDEELIDITLRGKVDVNIDYSQWNVTVIAYLDSGNTNVLNPSPALVEYLEDKKKLIADITGQVRVTIDALSIDYKMSVSLNNYEEVNVSIPLSIVKNVNPWFPNKWGNQQLYEVNTSFINSKNIVDHGISKDFGFRQIELVQDPLPNGRSFFFRINGIDVVIHGSNWIPGDAFEAPSRVNKSSMEKLFIGLADSGQNMIRNWGGGIYQHGFVYELADKYGIMVWEDFMFACAQYWVEETFINSTRKEVFDQVKRMQHHPSIAIWAGNNENSGDCGREPGPYAYLYFATILDNVAILDPTRPRVVSSPSNGDETESQPCSNGYDPFYGDLHSYNYGMDCWDYTQFGRSRFMSEFGLQSWPSFSTMSLYLPESEWSFMSNLMVNRNHHSNGQNQMLNLIQMHYNLPPKSLPQAKQFEYMLYLTQAYQAYCYKSEVEFFRSIRYQCTSSQSGCMMGQMYWQTNDIWPGASWSSMDWLARYKMSQYYSKRFYDKVIVAGFTNKTSKAYDFWIINDLLNESCSNCQLNFTSLSWSKGGIVKQWSTVFSMDVSDSKNIYSISQLSFLSQSGCLSVNDCVLKWNVGNGKGKIYSDNYMFIGSPKNATSKDPQISISDVLNGNVDQQYSITVSCSGVAAFVWLETKLDGYFSDNGMLLIPGKTNVIFQSRNNKTTINDVKSGVYVYSLFEAGGFK